METEIQGDSASPSAARYIRQFESRCAQAVSENASNVATKRTRRKGRICNRRQCLIRGQLRLSMPGPPGRMLGSTAGQRPAARCLVLILLRVCYYLPSSGGVQSKAPLCEETHSSQDRIAKVKSESWKSARAKAQAAVVCSGLTLSNLQLPSCRLQVMSGREVDVRRECLLVLLETCQSMAIPGLAGRELSR